MWRKFKQWICWLRQGKKPMECLFTVLLAEPGDGRCTGCRRNEWEEKCLMIGTHGAESDGEDEGDEA